MKHNKFNGVIQYKTAEDEIMYGPKNEEFRAKLNRHEPFLLGFSAHVIQPYYALIWVAELTGHQHDEVQWTCVPLPVLLQMAGIKKEFGADQEPLPATELYLYLRLHFGDQFDGMVRTFERKDQKCSYYSDTFDEITTRDFLQWLEDYRREDEPNEYFTPPTSPTPPTPSNQVLVYDDDE